MNKSSTSKALLFKDKWKEWKNQEKNTINISKQENTIKKQVMHLLDIPEKHPFQIEMDNYLDQNIVWQQEAKKEIVEAIMWKLLSFRESNEPIACLFFTGPTWVWKTQIVKVLAKFLLGNKNAYTRIACENYMESHSSTSLFWAPKSFVWYNDQTPLEYNNITRHYESAKNLNQIHDMIKILEWFNIILFDEIDKAHYNVKQSLLWLMDEWKVEFTNWKLSHFNNSIIIYTSNVWQQEVENERNSSSIWFTNTDNDDVENSKIINKVIKKSFSPEFMERISAVVEFEYLTEENCKEIIANHENFLNESLGKYYLHADISISLDSTIIDYIIDIWYTREKGARKLLRTINKQIENKLNLLLNSEGFEKYLLSDSPIILNILFENWKINFYVTSSEKYSNTIENTNIPEKKEDWEYMFDSKLKELNYLFTEISQYMEMYSINMDWDVDFRIELNEMEMKFKAIGFSREDILLMKNRSYIEELDDLHFISSFEWISIFSEKNKNIFHPYTQRNILKVIKNQIELHFDDIEENNNTWLYIVEIILPIIARLLKVDSLTQEQIWELMIYIKKSLTDKIF